MQWIQLFDWKKQKEKFTSHPIHTPSTAPTANTYCHTQTPPFSLPFHTLLPPPLVCPAHVTTVKCTPIRQLGAKLNLCRRSFLLLRVVVERVSGRGASGVWLCGVLNLQRCVWWWNSNLLMVCNRSQFCGPARHAVGRVKQVRKRESTRHSNAVSVCFTD